MRARNQRWSCECDLKFGTVLAALRFLRSHTRRLSVDEMRMNQSNRSFWKKSRRGNAQVLFQLLVFDIAEESGTEQGVSLPDVSETFAERAENTRVMFVAGREKNSLTPSSKRRRVAFSGRRTARSPDHQTRRLCFSSPQELAANLQPAGTVDCVDKDKHGQGGCRERDNRREGHDGLKADITAPAASSRLPKAAVNHL